MMTSAKPSPLTSPAPATDVPLLSPPSIPSIRKPLLPSRSASEAGGISTGGGTTIGPRPTTTSLKSKSRKSSKPSSSAPVVASVPETTRSAPPGLRLFSSRSGSASAVWKTWPCTVRALPSSATWRSAIAAASSATLAGSAGHGVDELEAAAAVEHEAGIQVGAVRDDEQAEPLPRVEVRGRVKCVQVHGVAGLERPAARPDQGQPRQGIGVLDAREHDLGVADRAIGVDQIDPEHVLEGGHLVLEGDHGIALGADGQARRIDAVDAVRVQATTFDQLGKRLQIRHGELPDVGLGFVAASASRFTEATGPQVVPGCVEYCSRRLYFTFD